MYMGREAGRARENRKKPSYVNSQRENGRKRQRASYVRKKQQKEDLANIPYTVKATEARTFQRYVKSNIYSGKY
jgi:hypothetical protein